MKTIQLTRGQVALVDDSDYPSLSQFRWYAKIDHTSGYQNYYAARTVYSKDANGKKIASIEYMHRRIMGLKPTDRCTVDHLDHNGLNNQQKNLKVVSQRLNNLNYRNGRQPYSKHKGITFYKNKKTKPWCVNIYLGRGRYNKVGFYNTEAEAIKALLNYYKQAQIQALAALKAVLATIPNLPRPKFPKNLNYGRKRK